MTLPNRIVTPALALFPVALVAGFFLLVKVTPPSPVTVTITKARAIELARAYLIHEGIPAGSWTADAATQSSDDLLSFVNARPNRVRLWSIAPPISGLITFRAPGASRAAEHARVFVSVDGRILGFNWQFDQTGTAARISDAEARDLASARVPVDFGFGSPSLEKDGERRVYTYHSSAIPDAELKAEVTLRNGRVISSQVTAKPNEEAPGASKKVQTALSICGFLFVCAVAVFSIYRYASRTLQQEVSHRRALIVALLCGSFCVLLGFNAGVSSDIGNIPPAAILVVFAIVGLVGGGLLAAAYGSGEGDIREAFPGKLTSLDALLTGRLFCRNTGISILSGMACAGWLVLALALALWPLHSREPQASATLALPFIRFSWLMPFVLYPLLSLSFAAAGLLQPLAFLQRRPRMSPRARLMVLPISAVLTSALRSHAASTAEFLVVSALIALALLLPFFLVDLFATLVCTTVVFSTLGSASGFAAAPALYGVSEFVHIGAGLGTLAFAIACVLRGRTYTEEQVRPLYARHIAQRKALEAEVSAAREAQLRLLPDSPPDFAGLDISAACVPAETVGGDFYDFFCLGDGRLGVFIAEGNNRGLAAALTIALAKGYLMQCVERCFEPVEILTRLETSLLAIFDESDDARSSLTDFAFAAIDTVAGEIRYARTGAYPKVVVVSSGAVIASERMVPVRGRATPISEGRAPLAPGDRIVLFTDGIGRRLAANNRRPEDEAASLVSRSRARKEKGDSESPTADEIRERFFNATRESLEPDDLTLVVIHLRALMAIEETAALGVVA